MAVGPDNRFRMNNANNTELKRRIVTEIRWNKHKAYLSSPEIILTRFKFFDRDYYY